MNRFIAFALTSILSSATLAAVPSSESIDKLLVLTDTQNQFAMMQGQIKKMVGASMQQAEQQYQLPEDKQRKLQQLTQTIIQNLMDDMSWDKMKTLYEQVYAQSFNQQEVNDLIEFYQSPTGKMFVAKMPKVIQNSMTLMQEKLRPMMLKNQQEMQKALQDLG